MNEQSRYLAPAGPGHYVAHPNLRSEYGYDDSGHFEPQERGLDLRALWGAVYRNRYVIGAALLLGLLAGFGAALLTAPSYRATATVQIDQQSAKVLNSQDVEPTPSAQEAERFLQTQVDVLKSRSLANRVAETLGFFKDVGFVTTMSNGKAPSETPVPTDARWREGIIGTVRGNLKVDLPRNSRVVQIHFESPDPALSAAVANSYAQNFITANLQRRFDTSAYSREFLQGQLAETKRRLETSERELIGYARSAGLIDASAGIAGGADLAGPKSLTTSNLVEMNQAYSQARSARVQAQQRWSQAQATPLMSLPEVLSNPTVQQLTQRRAELEAQYQEERQRRKEEHPAVMQAAAKIRELDRQINTLATSIRSSIRDQYQVAARQEQALQGNVGQLKGETLAEQDRGVRYNILKREVDTSRELYEGLLQRYREVSAAAGITANNISIIDRAEPPLAPIWPRPMLNMLLGGVAGLALALLLVFVRERFDDSVRAPEDVDRKLNLPLLGLVPLLPPKTLPKDALQDPRSSLSEAHSAMRTSLELSSDQGVPRTLLLTSSRQSEGKTTTAYATAKDFAEAGMNVLLVDSDLRKPSLHRLLNMHNRVGLSNVLARQKSLEEAIQPTAIDNLTFLSSGPLPPNPAQLLGTNAMAELLSQVKQTFDLVIIDGPPVLGLADAPRLGAAAEATIFVVEANGAHHGSARAALRRLMDSRVNILGVVLTKFNAKKAGYGQDYGYYYYDYRLESDKPAELQQVAAE